VFLPSFLILQYLPAPAVASYVIRTLPSAGNR
jgi:hypothetical protein